MPNQDELGELIDWMTDAGAIAGALQHYKNDHPEDPEMAGVLSIAKRIRGQMQSRLFDWYLHRENPRPHWYKKSSRMHCQVCSFPPEHESHLRCFQCDSPFHPNRFHYQQEKDENLQGSASQDCG